MDAPIAVRAASDLCLTVRRTGLASCTTVGLGPIRRLRSGGAIALHTTLAP